MISCPLGELVDITGGGTPSRKDPAYWNGDIPWVTVKDFKNARLSSAVESITELGLEKSASKLIPAGTVIIPTRMALGKAAINTVEVAINQDLKALTIKNTAQLNRDYLFRFILSKADYFNSRGKGATVKGITLDVLEELTVSLPPLEEQKRIAAILDKADAIRRKRQQAIELADQFLRSVFLDMFGDPVTNPKGWEVVPMGSAINFRGGSQPNKKHFIDHNRKGFTRLVQIRDFKSDKFPTYIPLEMAKRRFETDDVMIARYGPPVFQILRGLSGSYNVALMKAEPVEGKVTRDFVFHLLQTPRLHKYVVENSERTAGQSGVNLQLLNNYPLPVPPMDMQEQFTDRIRHAENIVSKNETQLRISKDLFQSLSQRAFCNKLDESR